VHAYDLDGKHVWTHYIRTKSRAYPLFIGDRILFTGYNQHAYLLDANGRLLDDLRICGAVNGSPAAMGDDAIIITATLMAQRIKFGAPKSPYGPTPEPHNVSVAWRGNHAVIGNPAGALINAHLELVDEGGGRWIQAMMSARSAFEIALPESGHAGRLEVSVCDADGRELARDTREKSKEIWAPQPAPITAWATNAYGLFDETAAGPSEEDRELQAVSIPNLYIGETDQAACIIRAQEPCRARVEVNFATPFGGAIKLYQLAPVSTINGEKAIDALVDLGDAGLVQLSGRQAVKIWVSANADAAAPGDYAGEIDVKPLEANLQPISLPLLIHVPDLRMRRPFPLALCTWDYIPNKWFPSRTKEVLDDMCRHGVSVWPRTNCAPKATADAAGNVVLDYAALDEELLRLQDRGQLLIQLGVPSVEFPAGTGDAAKHAGQIGYLHQLRDHLRSHGWDYDDYAFYPVDEPGLGFGPNIPPLIEAAKLFREADPKFRIYTDPVPTISRKDFDSIESLIDVWCPNMRMVTGLDAAEPRIKRIMDSGDTVWSYDCVAQVKSISPLRYNRAAAWRARHFGLDGIGFWTFSTTEHDHWTPPVKGIEEYALVYPGVMPVPSVRWEAVRDGLEDIAAAALLEQAIDKHKDDPARASLVEQAKQVLRIAQNDIVELSDQAFIESRDYLRQGDRRIWHTATDAAVYNEIRARIERLTIDLMN
jgi:hypothetical protein